MKGKIIRKVIMAAFLTFTCLIFGVTSVVSAEVEAGDVINSKNIDEMKDQEFEGHKIGDLLTDMVEMMIREKGLEIELKHSEPFPVDERWVEATEKYADQVKLNPETQNIEGYVAGTPFPDVDLDDPNAALKLAWNSQMVGGFPRGDIQWVPEFRFLFIDGDKGITREQTWTYLTAFYQGLLGEGRPHVVDENIYKRNITVGLSPSDIAGLGTYSIRYMDGKTDDMWAYLKSVRRVRRLSGGSWMDPIGGTDMLNDEMEVLNIHPSWYKGFEVVGKRHVLAICHSERPSFDKGSKSDLYPGIDHKTPPHWNPTDAWEPREVYELKAKLPEEHPYAEKRMYMDTQIPLLLYAEAYDHAGEMWKMIFFGMTPIKTEDGGYGILSNTGHMIDFKRNHATIFVHPMSSTWNPAGVDLDEIDVHLLKKAAQGKMDF
ncbi:MAG: DUF1329 domain-containing protein [Desulfobacterales bacterium]|nr:DUF1329 domain-containing protein [Desulfobacterales bacterium]